MVTALEKGKCEIVIKKRRGVTNHIKTVHAIAMCNLAELCAGLCIQGTLPKNLRWIPKGMKVQYLKKANSDLKGVCEFEEEKFKEGDNIMEVNVYDKAETKVFSAQITMYVTPKSAKTT